MADTLNLSFKFRNKQYVTAEAGLYAFAADLDKRFTKVPIAIKGELREYLRAVVKALKQRHGKPWPGGTSSKTLAKRSGDGRNSIKVRMGRGRKLDSISGGVEIGFPMSVHEKGATIRPKRSRYLAVPLPAALDKRGVPLRSGPREWDNTFVQANGSGDLLIFRREGRNITPLYILKNQVKLPPRLNAEKTLRGGTGLFVDKAMQAAMAELKRRG